ncbi:MAG: outer membrane protein transport protein [Myxococcales bacterium]|nr:outer membrane protein transport protein [Myxococcales bacterium]
MIRNAMVAVLCLGASVARAGGPLLPVQGVRSLERAGALVAGAEDADSLWTNPAGLARLRAGRAGKRALLFDAAYVYQTVDVVALDGTASSNLQPGHGIPGLAGALGLGDRLVLAGGLTAPYDTVHRYATDDTTGTLTFVVTAGVGYAVSDRLRVGATIQNHVTRTRRSLTTLACTGDPCDATDASLAMRLDIAQTDYLAPAGSLGVQLDVTPYVTLGALVQSPVRVAGQGTLTVQLPTAMQFASARVTGDRVAYEYARPPIVRAGVELRPRADLRVEAALSVELWSAVGAVTIAPDGVQLEDIAGGPFPLGEMQEPRSYDTSFAPSIAVEWHGDGVMLGAGYAYETAAVPSDQVAISTAIDAGKHVLGAGGGYEAYGWQIGGAVGVALLADVAVPATAAAVVPLAPLRAPTTTSPGNAGRYESRYIVGGLRFARRF